MSSNIVLLALGLLIVFWAVGAHSRLVKLHGDVKEALAQFGTQLQRRHELILALADAVKSNMQREHEAVDGVAAACDRAMANASKTLGNPADADALQRLAAAEGILSSSLDKLFALSEAHPTLHANQDMMRVTEELATTENKIAFARQVYNEGASRYNASIAQMPSAIAARLFGFKKAALLPAILAL